MDFLVLNRYLFDNSDSKKFKNFKKNIKDSDITKSDFYQNAKELKKELFRDKYVDIQQLVLFGKSEDG